MKQEIGRKQLRQFSLIVGGILLLMGFWPQVVHARPARFYLIWPAAALLVAGMAFPLMLRPVYKGWMALGEALGWLNSRIILGALFYLVVTPIGLIRRRLGQNPVRRGFESHAATYRIPRSGRPASHLKHQF
jgi:hypothetical protein